MAAYYNEIDSFSAAWLRELIKAGLIADGEVDERSIENVEPTDLRGFTQCHFFAGIGVWSYALRMAGWPDDLAVWTGSCPCQSFSQSQRGLGFADQRHLWPSWFRLIRECRPNTIFGEQVAGGGGLAWLDVVSADLENESYAIGATDLCAAGVGSPQFRQRLYFVAHTASLRFEDDSESRGLVCAPSSQSANEQSDLSGTAGGGLQDGHYPPNNAVTGFWRNADWLLCGPELRHPEGRWRPVEPNTLPLAHGSPARVGRLRGYGNAINAEVAKTFIAAYMSL